MVESNPEELVVSASKKAFNCIPNLKKAIEELTVLKAVGPATASGKLFDYRRETLTKNVWYICNDVKFPYLIVNLIENCLWWNFQCIFFLYFLAVLAAGAPEHAAFMADESMQALPGLQPLQYTVGFYLQYMDKIKPILKILQKGIQYINLTKGLRFQVIKVVL